MSEKVELAKAYVQIVPSAKGIKGKIEQALGNDPERAGQSAGKKLAGAIGKAAAAIGVGKIISDSINEGGKLQQSIGGIETLFKGTADKVVANAKNAFKTAGMSANEYMELTTSFSASLLQSLGGDTEKAAKYADMAIVDMSDNANKMGTSMESIQNAYSGFAKQNYTMLDNLKLGYGGTKEEMQRLLSDAEKISGVKYDISSYSDVVDAIHVMQTELNITGTTSKEAASTLAGSASMMKSSWTNLLGAISTGDDVGIAMINLTDSVSVFIFDNLIPMIGDMIKGLPELIYSLISEGIPDLLTKLTDNLENLLDSISESGVKNISKNGTNKLLPALGKLGLQVIKSIMKLAPKLLHAGFNLMVGFVKGLGDTKIFASIRETFERVKEKMLAPVEAAKNKISEIVNKIKAFFHFNISFPHIPLPHFAVSPSGWKFGDLLKGTIPSLAINWYAKGGVFDGPSVIGVGEKGPEAVVPLDKFWKRLDNNLNPQIDYERLGKEVAAAMSNVKIYNSISMDGKEVARATSPYMETELNRRSVRENRKLGLV